MKPLAPILLWACVAALPAAHADDLRCEPPNAAGHQRCQHPDGSSVERAFTADGRRAIVLLRRWADGTLAELRCAPASLLPGDREVCGHAGFTSDVTLYRQPGQALGTVSYRRGVLLQQTIVSPQGALVRSETFIDQPGDADRRVKRVYYPSGRLRHEIDLIERDPALHQGREGTGREFAENGQLTQEVVWVGGREQRVRQWYLNGQLKLDQQIRRLGRDELRETRSFQDNGQPAALNRERNGRLFGWQRYHAPGGALLREDEHGDRGVLLRRKHYDAQGRLLREERVTEDDSRV